MAVVLGELAHPRETRQRARDLVPVEHVERHVAQRQLAVRMLLGAVQQVVRRAVHRLERRVVLARLLVQDQEHVLAVLAPVSGRLPQHLVEQERGLDLPERLGLPLADEVHQQVVERRAPLGPEGGPGGGGMEGEEVELPSDAAVVPLPGLLQPVQVGVQLLLLEPGRAVDPLQHLAVLVAPPVRARGRQQLEVLEPPRAGDVRAAAQVLERPVGIDRDRLVVPQLADALELERIVGEAPVGLGAVDDFAHERVVARGHLPHPGLDPLEVLGRERPIDLEVVVEAVLDRRAEPDAGAGKQLADRGREDVRGRMPEHLQGVRIALGEDGEAGVALERPVEIPHGPVDSGRERRARQAGADPLGHLP